MRNLLFVAFFCLTQMVFAQQNQAIIPMPQSFVKANGMFKIDNHTTISINNAKLKQLAQYLKNELSVQKNVDIAINSKSNKPTIVLELVKDSKNTNQEAYRLVVSSKKITLTAASDKGIFYGIISLLQLASNNNEIQNCSIKDAPIYSWRGFMLDESRHFFGRDKVKSILNWMAFYKLNTFHWHLTDEPAWRIDILKYPNLALIGGKGDYLNPNLPAQYYSRADIKEIVAYAAERFIQVIPEIDMPGHATAANKAYPEFSGGGSAAHPDFTFNPGYEKTYGFLSDILKETHSLFPSDKIHLGGDEVSFGNEKWKVNPEIQTLKAKHALKDEKEVEKYFMKRMADSVYKLKSQVLVWDEMVDAGLPVDKTIMFWWRHDRPEVLKASLAKGYQTIICPRLPFYFDFVQDSTHKFGRKWDKKFNPVQSVYQFNPSQLVTENQSNILGIQANLWTETVADNKRLDYLLFPRLAALAETAWTCNENKNLEDFMDRLKSHLLLYKAAGLYYYNPFNPIENPEPAGGKKLPLNYKD
ncbi:beta-N-acetylhexosaminidase [Pedobacter punctiformis]|uniref:beta-N-acetylhexosaminidase n=1 Tax=Pedobacter punctiformis TaxID=3004097 RepID=A0ABT4L8C1_9SPHI|nr:beta-N-acetylhexosaminidase [Pedobacter sp. HCMS5-2]MCZ4244182.1 beta-N-acetylhexosaminidase [Pedobacter sp. HCMS5-2]